MSSKIFPHLTRGETARRVAKLEQSEVVVSWSSRDADAWGVFILSVELRSPSLPEPMITTMPMRTNENGMLVLVWPHQETEAERS